MEQPRQKSGWFTRELVIGVVGVAAAAGAAVVANNYSLWILVPIPAAIAVVYHLLNLESRYDNRKKIVEEYRNFTLAFDQTWTQRDTVASVNEDLTDDIDSHRPTLGSVLWGAALLTAVFTIPAIISDGGAKLAKTTDPALASVSAAVDKAIAASGESSRATMSQIRTALAEAKQSVTDAKRGLEEWQLALVYSGFGVWVLIVMRTIGRINAGGLNARFLITASLRASAAMMLGFFAGAVQFFQGAEVAGPVAYFLIGIFYPFFFEQLRDQGYKLFRRKKSITEELPTSWIDGVDDDTEDILTEANILSVQHLATADPGVLTVRTLFPFNRVLDLIDQAILVTYFRENIVEMRKCGVRGVIDFVALVQPVVQKKRGPERDRSEATLKELAAKLQMSVETLISIGDSVFRDYRVNVIVRLWQHCLQPEGYSVQREEGQSAMVGSSEPKLLATQPAAMSYSGFDRLARVQSEIDGNLREEANQRAVRFREENPDLYKPADDWLSASFTEAYTAAQQKATVGLNPKPGAKAKDLYEQAFLSALGNVANA